MISYRGRVEKIVSGGEGLLRLDGQVVFLPQVLPGELVEFVIEEEKKGYRRGRVKKILEASPHRVVPPCELYGTCGGCDLMHAPIAFQRELKQQIVQENFRRIAKREVPLPPIQSSQEWHYRNRIQLHRDRSGQVGFKERSGNRLVKVSHCPVAVSGFKKLWDSDLKTLDWAEDRMNLFALDDPDRGYFVQGRDKIVTVELSGKRIVFSLEGFFQSNLSLLPTLIQGVMDFLFYGQEISGESRALDLFCGCGLFGAFMADHGAQVTAVEENRPAIELAKKNIPGPLHEFVPLSLEDWVRKRRPLADNYAAVVVDPPRTGLSASVVDFLGQVKAPRIAYVSCNPDTLARDVAVLEKQGWKMVRLELFDFYPQTSHIEALACLERV